MNKKKEKKSVIVNEKYVMIQSYSTKDNTIRQYLIHAIAYPLTPLDQDEEEPTQRTYVPSVYIVDGHPVDCIDGHFKAVEE